MLNADPSLPFKLNLEISSNEPQRAVAGILVSQHVEQKRDFLAPILDRAADPDPKIRATVARVLGGFDSPQSLQALKGLLRDDDDRVIANTLEALESKAKLPTALVQAFLRHPSPRVRANEAVLMGSHDPAAARAAVESLLHHADPASRLSGRWADAQIADLDNPSWREAAVRPVREVSP